jgi:hypothetical protein
MNIVLSIQQNLKNRGPHLSRSEPAASGRSITHGLHGLTSLDLGSREPHNATWGHPSRMPHTYRTPTHPSQSSPLSPGKASVTDMTTCNGYIHFF